MTADRLRGRNRHGSVVLICALGVTAPVFHEFWHLDVRRRNAKRVMHHRDPTIDVLSRTDSDDRNAQFLRDALGALLEYCLRQ
jgi:hypothetical protein